MLSPFNKWGEPPKLFLQRLLMTLHTSYRLNIMHEKWGHSDCNGFDIKMMVKSNAIEIVAV
jgi:hypothetical protein